jgi:beta-glucosidase
MGGAAVDVYLTHLHHVREEESLRVFQTEQLLGWIGSRDTPAARLVCGDFNAVPGSPPIRLMEGSFARTQSELTFPTPLRYASYAEHHGEPEETFNVCLDYIWYQSPLRLVDQGRCFDRGSGVDRYLWPSDHIGLWADFELDQSTI